MEFKYEIMLHGFSEVNVGGRLVRWGGGKGGRVMRWQGGKGGRVVRWEGGRFLVLFKGGEHRVSPRFYLFVSDVNQGNEGDGLKIFLHVHRDGRHSLDLPRAAKNSRV